MKTVSLKMGERLSLTSAVNGVKGDLQTINRVFKILDKLNPTEVEKKKLKIVFAGSDVRWDVKLDKDVSLEFTEEEYELVKDELKKKSDYSAADRFLPSAAEKFEAIEVEKKEEKKK